MHPLLFAVLLLVGPGGEPVPGLHPDFPVVEGRHQMTREWWVTLPEPCNRRVEEGDWVLWRPGFTVWTVVYGNDNSETRAERLEWLRSTADPSRFDEQVIEDGPVTRFAYRLNEQREHGTVRALYGFAIHDSGHVQTAVYFDAEPDATKATQLWRSLEHIAAE